MGEFIAVAWGTHILLLVVAAACAAVVITKWHSSGMRDCLDFRIASLITKETVRHGDSF